MTCPSGAPFVDPTAEVSSEATIGDGCRIWRQVHVREGAVVGGGTTIGAGTYVGAGVRVGRNCKIQNNALLYEGLKLEDGVFVGPQVCFTNDLLPRAVNPDLSLKTADDWHVGQTRVGEGASVGAQSVVIAGVRIGRWALVGAGSVVTRDVPEHALVFGQPARIRGWVCFCARRLLVREGDAGVQGWCAVCGRSLTLPAGAASDLESALARRQSAATASAGDSRLDGSPADPLVSGRDGELDGLQVADGEIAERRVDLDAH